MLLKLPEIAIFKAYKQYLKTTCLGTLISFYIFFPCKNVPPPKNVRIELFDNSNFTMKLNWSGNTS